jgi:hypothetical protein
MCYNSEDHILVGEHKVFENWRVADAVLADGQVVPVGFKFKEVDHHLRSGQSVDVLFLMSDEPLTAEGEAYFALAFRTSPLKKAELDRALP